MKHRARTIKKTLYVYWFADVGDFWVRDSPLHEGADEGTVLVATQEGYFAIPVFDPTDTLVTQLEAMKRKLQADTQAKLNQIDEKIQSLLALPGPQ